MATKYPLLDYFQLQKDINSKPIKSVYLMVGEESYLQNMVIEQFKTRFQQDKQLVNYETFYGENLDLNRLANSLQILPLGGGKQCIIIKQLDKVKGTFAKKLDFMINNLSFCDVDLIILLFSLDKKIPVNISLDKIKQFGVVALLKKPKSFQIKQWISLKCRENHKEISSEAIYYLQRLTDNDLGQIENEMLKLFCFLDNSSPRISRDDIINIFYGTEAGNIFDFVDAIGERKTETALCLLNKLEKSEYHPLSLLAMISRQIRLILQVKRYKGDIKKLKGELHLPPFVMNKLIGQSQKYHLYELKNAYPNLLDAEIKLKTGYHDPVIILEQLVVRITK
jgi:DNA polymerase-3 subunit delta